MALLKFLKLTIVIIILIALHIFLRNDTCHNTVTKPGIETPIFLCDFGTDSQTILMSQIKSQVILLIGVSSQGLPVRHPAILLIKGKFSLFVCLFIYFISRISGRHCSQIKRGNFCKKRRINLLAISKSKVPIPKIVILLLMLLLLCGDVHPQPGPTLPFSRRHPNAQLITVAAWNVRTLLLTKRAVVRPTAIIARELDRYKIDIAALSETRVQGENTIEEVGGGYTFFLKGRPVGEKGQHGVGFAIRSKLLRELDIKEPMGINERLMSLDVPLVDQTLSIISAYAPTLPSSEESKESFYGTLMDTIRAVPLPHKLLVMGDFNARVGTDHNSWEKVIGPHGVGNENSNGTRLLSMCSQLDLIITNTIFPQANAKKTSWMHPGSKQWHMIDYVITRQRDIKDVHHTRAMCGSSTWTDHKLIRSKLALRPKKAQQRHRLKPRRKLDVGKLRSEEVRTSLASKLQQCLDTADVTCATAKEKCDHFSKTTLRVAEEVLGYPERKHRDWFDENDPHIKPLLTQLHDLRVKAINSSTDAITTAYRSSKQAVQKALRHMKDFWWCERAADLQRASDRRDLKTFYQGLKAVYGPIHKASSYIKSKTGVLLSEPRQVLGRWAEHFSGVLNQHSQFDMSILEELPQWEVNMGLDMLPTIEEVKVSIKQLTSGKSPGEDGIPPDVYMHGGVAVAEQLLDLFVCIWKEGQVPSNFKDATIIHLYKNKGDRAVCDNHRGISLLCIVGKVLARLMLNRLIKHINAIDLVSESQCGFRKDRGTNDMVFSIRQLQEKCKLKGQDLYLLFIDLTKAFDTVNRAGLWCILEKIGCPQHFVGIIASFHENMSATVREGSNMSPPFTVTSGTKQGCVLAPTLFSIFFSLMLHVAFKDNSDGIRIRSRFDKGLCRISSANFKAESKVSVSTIRDLLYADDCALAAPSLESLQRLCDRFSVAARRFGLTISIKKTEALYQPAPGNAYEHPVITIDGQQLNAVVKFNYLGSIISNDASIDAEITARIAKATSAFGRLTKRLWTNRDIRLDTKIAVYKAVVITSLLYGCETWSLKRKHILRLEKFHQTCLRRIARIRWFHKVTNYMVLSRCNITSLQFMLDAARLRWTGHVVRMADSRIPKALLYGSLVVGAGRPGNHKTYLNGIKKTLSACAINPTHLETLASERETWRSTYKAGIVKAEDDRIKHLIHKHEQRRALADLVYQPTHNQCTPPPNSFAGR